MKAEKGLRTILMERRGMGFLKFVGSVKEILRILSRIIQFIFTDQLVK